MGFLVGLVLLTQAEAGEGKDACRKAIEAFHAETKAGTETARISSIETLSKHHCVPAIAAIAPLLQAPEEPVRVAAARALGAMEHLEAVETLAGSLAANESSKAALEAIVKGLQTLDWEAGAEPLNALLVKYHEKGMMDELKPVVQALGSLGSAGSVDPLLKLLEHAEIEAQGGRVGKVRSTPNPKLKALEAPIRAALQAITGGNEPNHKAWHEWWQANRERLVESATLIYRCRLTGKRWEQKSGEAPSCPNHDKPERDGQLVKTRLKPRA
jgi:hypothetical protein